MNGEVDVISWVYDEADRMIGEKNENKISD